MFNGKTDRYSCSTRATRKRRGKKEIVERNMPFKGKLYAALFVPENSCIEKHRYSKTEYLYEKQ